MNILLLNLISIELQCCMYCYSLDYSPSKMEEACVGGSDLHRLVGDDTPLWTGSGGLIQMDVRGNVPT